MEDVEEISACVDRWQTQRHRNKKWLKGATIVVLFFVVFVSACLFLSNCKASVCLLVFVRFSGNLCCIKAAGCLVGES